MLGIIDTWPQSDIALVICIMLIVFTLLVCTLFNSLWAVFVWHRYLEMHF